MNISNEYTNKIFIYILVFVPRFGVKEGFAPTFYGLQTLSNMVSFHLI